MSGDNDERIWRQLFLTNQLTMALYAAWAREESEIETLFAMQLAEFKDRPGRYNEELKRRTRWFNDVDVYMTMAALFRQAYADDDERYLNLSRLVGEVPDPGPDIKKLRERILPMLSELGYIEEFGVKQEGSSEGHKIALTTQGIDGHREFLTRCERIIRQIDEEKAAMHHRLLRE